MEKIKIWNNKTSDKQLVAICDNIKAGEIGIIPTDSLYAICGDALNMQAIEKICRLKGINPEKTNLSIICSDISMAAEYARIENKDFRLMQQNTPGEFTFLLRASSKLPRSFKRRKIVGIRIPANEFDRALVAKLGNPLICTSIEYPESDYAINPELIAENYAGKIDFMVEGEEGRTEQTTIVDCTGNEPEIIREGIGEI